jgi:CDP-glucose 4,6-dehydratase
MDKVTINLRDMIDCFNGKKVFITGHTGFKGTWMTFFLSQIGADVKGYALEPETNPSHFKLLGLEKKIHNVFADIRDKERLTKEIQSFQPEFVIHMAAQALVKRSYNDPVTNFETNVMGSVNLMEAVRLTPSVRSLVYITSDKCYDNKEWIWGYRETDRLGGHDPYSASKAAAEIAFDAYSRSYFHSNPKLGYASTRAGNVIGGGDWSADRIIPDCIRAIESNKPILLRNPKATRPWQHVIEPISGYLLLAYQLYKDPSKYIGSWNFGPPSTQVRTVHEVTKSIIDNFGKGSIEIEGNQNNQHEAMLLQLNCDKAHQLLNWYPRWDVNKTLKATSEWYKNFLDGNNVEEMTKKQLKEYFAEWQ